MNNEIDEKNLFFKKWIDKESLVLNKISHHFSDIKDNLKINTKLDLLHDKPHINKIKSYKPTKVTKLNNKYNRYYFIFNQNNFNSDFLSNIELVFKKNKTKNFIDKMSIEIGDKFLDEVPKQIIPELMHFYNLKIKEGKNYMIHPLPIDIFHNGNILPIGLLKENIKIIVDIKNKVENVTLRLNNIFVDEFEKKPLVMVLKYIQYTKKFIEQSTKFTLYYHFFYHPIQVLFFCFVKDDKIVKESVIKKFEFVLDDYVYYSATDEILKLDSQKYTKQEGMYALQISPYKSHSKYSIQSSLNFSNIDNVFLNFDFSITNKKNIKLYIFGITNNLAEIKDGKYNLVFKKKCLL